MANTINLLAPSTVIKKRNASRFYSKLLTAGCICAVLLISAGAVGFYVLNWQLSKDLDLLNNEVKALDTKSGRAIAAESFKSRFNETANDVHVLQVQKPVLSINIDELLKMTPVNVYVTNLEFKNNPFEATVKGVVYSQAVVAQFESNLQRSERFKDSIIRSSEKKEGEKTFTFVLSVSPDKKGGKQ